jgi:hypothetical protein
MMLVQTIDLADKNHFAQSTAATGGWSAIFGHAPDLLAGNPERI